MKKISFCAMLIVLLLSSTNILAVIFNKQLPIVYQTGVPRDFGYQASPTLFYMGFHINKTMTATNGCKITIVGDYNIVLGEFTGTVTIKCPGSVSATVLTFGLSVLPSGQDMSYVSGDQDGWEAFFANDPQLRQEVATAIVTP